ncbi:MAG: cation:proton antiporter [Firmicutes bacterium]|nr:cation:proton antiporter [Bacillota bacterium]
MGTLFYISIVLLVGLLTAKLASLAKLPNVTGYLVGGLIIGPSILKIIPKATVTHMGIVSEAALGMIAFGIGSEFSFKHLKQLGSGIITLTVIQALSAFAAVAAVIVLIFGQGIAVGLVLGGIGVATAPAATLLVVRQYKAKGPVVDTLLPVVAIDDAVGIIVFGLCIAAVKAVHMPQGNFSLAASIIKPVWEIVFAVIIGLILGLVLSYIAPRVRGDEELLGITLAMVFLGVALATKFNISSLLLCMTMGGVLTNLTTNSPKVFGLIDKFTPPIYVAFFTLSGADLDLSILKSVGLIGIGYIISRSIGKIFGAYIGARIINSPPAVQKYLGITLLPQAGVAIGLSLVAQSALPEFGASIRTVVLFATLIYELVGPVLTKLALIGAGEIQTRS